MLYIILLLLSLFIFGPLIFILLSFLIFRKKVGLFVNVNQIQEMINSMMQKMQKGENFSEFYKNHSGSSSTGSKSDMSRQEALEILGLEKNATKAEINKAYHKLIQKVHPDKGGSHYFAQQLNKARETLLK